MKYLTRLLASLFIFLVGAAMVVASVYYAESTPGTQDGTAWSAIVGALIAGAGALISFFVLEESE